MVFFRIKKIKGKEYAYIVANEWGKNGSRQKVKGYLGRVHRFDLKHNVEFFQFVKSESIDKYINENNENKMINDLIEWELFKFGVNKGKFALDFSNKKIKKNIVIAINDGFLCNLTLKNLLEFKPEDEQNDGYRLARAFVEAGIKVPQEIFVGVFNKLYKTISKW